MASLLMRVLFFVSAVMLAALVTLDRSCTAYYRFPSPGHESAVLLTVDANLGDSDLKVALQEGWSSFGWSTTLASKSDCSLNFAHTAWTPDARRLAVFVSATICGNIWVGYDRATRQFPPFGEVADLMRTSLRQDYRLTEQDLAAWRGDPLLWMQGDDMRRPAAEAYRQRYAPAR